MLQSALAVAALTLYTLSN
jgi:NADPH-dependent 2,4-dienoyl-CoA reductase/sulfur reductase-like enzyme/nitrite reductase/ring-hydroxylating ferredoxin subunit